MIDFQQNLRYLAFAEKTFGFAYPDARFITVVDDREIKAITLYNNFTDYHCEMTVYAQPGTLSKKYLRVMFTYPFYTLKLIRVNAWVRESNTKSRIAAQRVGFEQEGIVQKWYGNESGIMYGMLKENCKWINHV